MIIGGYLPCSLCDFPGRVAASVFTQGCNFRCPFCHNGTLLSLCPNPENRIDTDEVLRHLSSRKGLLDGVVITGGEPTMQDGLLGFASEVRSMGFSIKLDTNGSRPNIIRALLSADLLDYIAMDVKAPPDKYDLLAGVAAPIEEIMESIFLIAQSDIPHQFRTTVVPKLLSENDALSIRKMLPAGSLYKLQQFRSEHALDESLRA